MIENPCILGAGELAILEDWTNSAPSPPTRQLMTISPTPEDLAPSSVLYWHGADGIHAHQHINKNYF